MALIYLKGSDKTLILSPREGVMRQFDFGDWTELRMGMFLRTVASVGDDTPAVPEYLLQGSSADRLTIGLKTNDEGIPGAAGTNFIGMTSVGNAGDGGSAAGIWDPWGSFSAKLSACTAVGSTFTANPVVASWYGLHYPALSGASAYNGFWGLKIVINNKGTATQSVNLHVAKVDSVAGTDYSTSALRTRLNNETYTSMGAALQWNDGAAARTLPDCFWVRLPFFTTRLRISAMRMIRYAPV